MRRAAILLGLFLLCGCPSNGTPPQPEAPQPEEELVLAIDYATKEHSDDSNTQRVVVRLDDGELTVRVSSSGAHAEAPEESSRELTGEEIQSVEALIEAEGLLDAASHTGNMDPGDSDYFFVVTHAKVELQLKGRRNDLELKGITGLVRQEAPFDEHPTLASVRKLKSKLEALAKK